MNTATVPHNLHTMAAAAQTTSSGAPTRAGAVAVRRPKVRPTASTATSPAKKFRNGRSRTLWAVTVSDESKPHTRTTDTSNQASKSARLSSAAANDSGARPRSGPSARTSHEDGARG